MGEAAAREGWRGCGRGRAGYKRVGEVGVRECVRARACGKQGRKADLTCLSKLHCMRGNEGAAVSKHTGIKMNLADVENTAIRLHRRAAPELLK